MKKMIVLVAFVLTGCPSNPPTPPDAAPPPPPPPVMDAAPTPPPPAADDCTLACAALKTAGCSIASDAQACASFLTTMQASKAHPNPVTQKPLTCADIKGVQTKADAQKLSFSCQ